MFIHNFKYSLKLLIRSKQLVFWTLAFPLIMAVLFNMAFSNIENSENFDAIDIAVVNSKDFDDSKIFKESLKSLSDESNDDRVFNIQYTDLGSAKQLLADEKIKGYLSFSGDDVKVTVKSNGTSETILKFVVDEIKSDSSAIINIGIGRIAKKAQEVKLADLDIDYEEFFKELAVEITNEPVNIKDTSNSHMSYVMIEYYSLIAMACMYSGMFSMVLVNFKLANMSPVGKRSAVSPVKKSGMLLGSLAAGYIVQLFGIILLFGFTVFALGVDYGEHFPMIILLSLVGSLAGLSMGVAVGTLVKKGENAKVTILISVTMAGCFLAGMMGISMKNIIDKNVPVFNKINPVAMITDGLYALYYYGISERVWIDIISLAVFSAVMILLSWSGLRRQKYDNI